MRFFAIVVAAAALASFGPIRAAAGAELGEVSQLDESESEAVDRQIRRVLLGLLAGESSESESEPDPETGLTDAVLQERMARVLRQLVAEQEAEPKPIETADDAEVLPTLLEGIAPDPEEEGAQVAETRLERVQDSGSQEEERARTLYDEGAELVHDTDKLTLGGFAQVALNDFWGEHPTQGEFQIPRARVDLRGAAAEGFSYRIFWDLDREGARLEDVWLDYTTARFARGRVGQFKVPFSLEALYSARWIRFTERSLGPLNIAPFRDIGVNAYGKAFGDSLEYAVGVFDGKEGKLGTGSNPEVAARASWQANRFLGMPFSQGVHMGVSFTHRGFRGPIGGLDYETSSGTPFFEFADEVRHEGVLTRFGSEIEWMQGSWYVASEYMKLWRNGVSGADASANVWSESVYVAASWIFTGEAQTRNRPVRPNQKVSLRDKEFGALDFHTRWNYFRTDPEAVDLGLAVGADRLWSVTADFNWWPQRNLRTVLEFELTDFNRDVVIDEISLDREFTFKFLTQFEF